MRIPREDQFDPANPPWLHCISRCVRRAFLCGDGFEHRKEWLERRLRLLARCFQVDVGAYAIMSNHIHVVARPRPQRCVELSAEEIATAYWCMRFDVDPVDDVAETPLDRDHIQALAHDVKFIADWRTRLGEIGWFMKVLKEPLSRIANKEDNCSGAFWEGRFKSVPLLDVAAVVACTAYVDLNPIRADIAHMPEESDFTSVKMRIQQRRARQRAEQKRKTGNKQAAARILEQAGLNTRKHRIPVGQAGVPTAKQARSERIYRSWLTPIEEMTRTNMLDPGMQLEHYLTIVDTTGRLIRDDKPSGVIQRELAAILQRLDGDWNMEQWMSTMSKPRSLGGAVLGGIKTLAREAKRRSTQWFQSRCPLFTGGRDKEQSPAIILRS